MSDCVGHGDLISSRCFGHFILWHFLGCLRSTGDLDARNTILEAVRPQAGDVLVADLHLAALEVHGLVQADLVVLGVLQGS